jgi:NAD(P)-dependent dehydrogenase (short-subunit alcohol dehydrogenase family)
MGVYLVTGAASGIGLATTKALAAEGHQVFALDRDGDRLATAFDGLGGPQPNAVIADVADPDSLVGALARVGDRTTVLDGLVNAAGVVSVVPFEDLTADDWETTYRINVVGPFLVLQAALPLLRAAEAPSVVNLARWPARSRACTWPRTTPARRRSSASPDRPRSRSHPRYE